MTALERLRMLAGTQGTTGDALVRLAGATGMARALLVAYSNLPSGTASTRLMHGKPVTGAVVDGRNTLPTKRAVPSSTDRQSVLQTIGRADTLLTQRADAITETERFITATASRAVQINITSRPASRGGKRK